MVRLSLNLLNSLNSPSAIDEPLSKSAWGHPTAKTSILILNREHRVRSTPTNFSHRHVRHECISRIWSPWFALLSNILSHGLPSNSVHSTYYRALYWILFDCHWFHQNFHSKQLQFEVHLKHLIERTLNFSSNWLVFVFVFAGSKTVFMFVFTQMSSEFCTKQFVHTTQLSPFHHQSTNGKPNFMNRWCSPKICVQNCEIVEESPRNRFCVVRYLIVWIQD